MSEELTVGVTKGSTFVVHPAEIIVDLLTTGREQTIMEQSITEGNVVHDRVALYDRLQ